MNNKAITFNIKKRALDYWYIELHVVLSETVTTSKIGVPTTPFVIFAVAAITMSFPGKGFIAHVVFPLQLFGAASQSVALLGIHALT